MLDNKHEVILHKNDRFVGTGHNSTLLEDDEKNTWMLYHALNWNVWMRNGKFCWTAFCGMKTAGLTLT